MDCLKHMLDNRLNRQCVARTLEACVDHGKLEYGATILDLARERLGADCVKTEDFHRYHFKTLRQAASAEEAIAFVASLDAVGVRMDGKAISSALMPKVMASRPQLRDAVARLVAFRRVFSATQVANNGLLHLFCQESAEDFGEAVAYMLHNKMVWKPLIWNASLSRSYLATGDMDCLVTVFFVGSMLNVDRQTEGHEVYLFRTLAHMLSNGHRYKSDFSPEERLTKVLLEMKRLDIGIPQGAATLLEPNLTLDTTKALLEDLQQVHEEKDKLWPYERKMEFLKERRKAHTSLRERSTLEVDDGFGNVTKVGADGYLSEEHMPKDVHRMIALFDSMLERKQLNMDLTRRLQEALVKKAMFEELVHVVCNAIELGLMPLPMVL